MKYLNQEFNFVDDSISYRLFGDVEPFYTVDSSGYLTKQGVDLGKFVLRENRWHLYLDATGLYMTGPDNGLFKLPEFELKALTTLVNQE